MMDKDLLRDVQNELIKAQKQGLSFAEFQKNVKPMLMKKGWWGEKVMVDPVDGKAKLVQLGSTRRLRTIYQTNMRTARAASQWQRIQESKRFLPYLRYNDSAAQNKRDAHQKYYGWILPVDHPIWQYIFPPNGYGCLCTVSQLTRGQAEREGITPEPEIEWKEVVNKRTGQVVRVPAGIDPSFAHNHGDRLKALEALFGEKHGQNALQEMIVARESYLSERFTFDSSGLDTLVFPKLDKPTIEKGLKRLMVNHAENNIQKHEALAAIGWEKRYKQTLQPYDLKVAKGEKQPDFMIVNPAEPDKKKWQTIDFMFTMSLPESKESKEAFKISKFNEYFANTGTTWRNLQDQIIAHTQKADFVPLDLRHLNAQNRLKLLQFLVELPEEQQKKIVLIMEKNK